MPKTWDLRKAKHLFERVQRPVRESDGIVTAFRDGEVTLRSNRREEGFTNAVKEIGYQGVRKGDLLVHAMDGFAGAIGVSDSDGKCSPVCSVCTPWDKSKIDIRYYGYLVRQLAVTDYITSLAKGIRERSTEFRFSEFAVLELALPSKPEQTQIAKFLDHETAKIDRLIEKQEELIRLLKEKRQAVISHAVTKGLNPHAPLKDSGISWLGQVPAHWVVAGFRKYLSSIVDYRGKTPDKVDSGVFLVTARNIKNGRIDYEVAQEFIKKSDYESVMSRGKPKIGDILFTTEAPLGEVALVDRGDIALAQRIIKFDARPDILSNSFLKYLITSDSFQQSLAMFASGSTALGIKAERFVYLRALIPPLDEQSAIVRHIEQTIQRLERIEKRAEAQTTLLQERRTALISAAVTGKIDVRHWQPPASTEQ